LFKLHNSYPLSVMPVPVFTSLSLQHTFCIYHYLVRFVTKLYW
jgi:hypothetical protein